MAFESALDKRVRVPDSILLRELNGESVILNLHTGQYFGLDEVGTRMWSVLGASVSLQAAYETLLRKYEVEPATLQHDLTGLVACLVDQGLLQVVDA